VLVSKESSQGCFGPSLGAIYGDFHQKEVDGRFEVEECCKQDFLALKLQGRDEAERC
jgi:hypothetical protein